MVLRYRTSAVTRLDNYPHLRDNYPLWTHPGVLYWRDDWRLIRDAAAGEKEVKDAAQAYLPQLDAQDNAEYDAYRDRATYYNFTGRTVSALVGSLFKREPVVESLPADLEDQLETITRSNSTFSSLLWSLTDEFMRLWRVGVLVDLPSGETTTPRPYLTPYIAENILDWDTEVLDETTGREVLSYVVLREWKASRPATPTSVVRGKNAAQKRYFASYRVLKLEYDEAFGRYIYVQYLYTKEGADADLSTTKEGVRVVPLRRGEPLDFIPFEIVGGAEVQKPELLDIARLNISHYRSYAHLEHGLFFVGLPVYYVEIDSNAEGGGDYFIGPAKVWEVGKGSKPGLLEFNGSGLKGLFDACAHKEAQAASLGGRMIGVTSQSTAETDNQTNLKERNEQSLLLMAARALEESTTKVMRWWAWLANAGREEAQAIRVAWNKDFLYATIGSREFRAIQSMFKDGLIPIEVVYDYLRKADVIPDKMTLADLKALLESASSFPNQPDFDARKEGYPNAQAKVSAEAKDRELDIAEDTLEADIDAAEADREAQVKQAAAQAKAAAAAPKGDPAVARQVGSARQPGAKPKPKAATPKK